MNRFDLENAGKLWFAKVWVGGQNDNYQNRDQIINNFNNLISTTGFRIGRGWQPYDPVVRPARKYTAIAQDLDQNPIANANAFRNFLSGAVLLANLPSRALQELALITCFAEVGRGYSSSLQTLGTWVNSITAGQSTWSQVKLEFDPALTYAEDSSRDWSPN